MKKFSEQLHKKSQTVKLKSDEKRELRERLVSYMEYHPLPAEMKNSAPATKKISNKNKKQHLPFNEAYTNVAVPFLKIFKTSAVAAAVVLVVLPFAAEKSVPGDVLYAIKVEFNEELKSSLIFDSFQKVEWETELLNRRIAEARLLESEGRLTEEVSAEVAQAVKTHTENAKREIEQLRTQDADEAVIATIALETTLEVQATALQSDEEEADEESAAAEIIAEAIDESRSETEVYNASSTVPAYNKLIARVEKNTTRVYELLNSIKETTPEIKLAEVTRRIEDIDRSVQSAIELSETEGNEAQIQLIDVIQRTQKLIVYMTELEVSETVDIEDLVPVVLTDAEEDAEIDDLTQELDAKKEQINKFYQGVEETEILEKTDAALVFIDELSAKLASSTKNLDQFKAIASEANAIADDTIILLERYLNPEEVVIEVETETGTTTEAGTEPAETASSTEETIEEVSEEIEETNPVEEVEPTETSTTTEEVIEPEEAPSATTTVDSI